MSYLHSTRLSRSQSVVAIAGATGNLGKDITHVFLTAYHPFFPRVYVLVRDLKSTEALKLAEMGAQLRDLHDADALSGVDVLVSALSVPAIDVQDVLFDRALAAGVLVYFPSEFGIDHHPNDFPGFDHPDWERKARHVQRAREKADGKIKIISVYNGLFLDTCIVPWFGFDTAQSKFTCVGPATQRVTLTAKADIGRSVCELAILACTDPSKVPDEVRIAGDTPRFVDIRDTMQRLRAGQEIVLQEEDLDAFRSEVQTKMLRGEDIKPSWHLRILGGEGKLDYSTVNQNELVNPGEKCWKWKKLPEVIS